jgi:hypothetical protein
LRWFLGADDREKRALVSADDDLKLRERFAVRDHAFAYEGNVGAKTVFSKMRFMQYPCGQNTPTTCTRVKLVTIGPDRSFA